MKIIDSLLKFFGKTEIDEFFRSEFFLRTRTKDGISKIQRTTQYW